MARKNVLNYRLVANQSLAASFNSAPTLITNTDNVAYQINITTTNSTGTFSVQGSVDYTAVEVGASQASNTNPHWVDITLGGGTPTVAASNDSILIDLNQLPFNAVRIAYTSTVAGTGHADIYVMTKQIGG